MAITAQTAPGFYATVTDKSFVTTPTSRFHAGLIGVAEKGPFDTAVAIGSLSDFRRVYGKTLSNSYMATAAGLLSDLSDGTVCVRVGRQYTPVTTFDASGIAFDSSGSSGAYTVFTPKAVLFSPNTYIRISQPGKKTTVNAKIASVPGTNDRLTLVSNTAEAVPLADTYNSASIDMCADSGAANEAEAFLHAYSYTALPSVGVAVGDKNSYTFYCTNSDAATTLAAGDLLKLEQTGLKSTLEVRVKSVSPVFNGKVTIALETSSQTEVGYQVLALQDSYSAAAVSRVTKSASVIQTTLALPLLAASAGTWANSDGVKTGLVVNVAPGSNAGTKKLLVFQDSSLVETIDNLTTDQTSADYYVTRVQGNSQYVTIPANFDVTAHPANTVNPWNSNKLPVWNGSVAAAPVTSAINQAAFTGGFNGVTTTSNDTGAWVQQFVGTVDPSDDSHTGLKVFDNENIKVDVICAPDVSTLISDSLSMPVAQELARVARKVFAVGLIDVPQGLNAREAIDWHNGAGLYSYRGRLDTYSLHCSWNWETVTDPMTGVQVIAPPTIGVMLRLAETFDQYAPWIAAAGEIRGRMTEASAVEFDHVSAETRAAMYGNGNSVNPILSLRGNLVLFGERTMQRTESKLTALHSVILTNQVVNGLDVLGRQFIFDPNDPTLLNEMRVAFTGFLEGISNKRGFEDYKLVMDSSNNTATTRNRREVIVDLSYIPVDAVERIYLNCIVRESGAMLNSVS